MIQMSRMDIRIPLTVRETIDLAASLEGRTRTDFLIEAAADKARKVIAEHQVINLSLNDQQLLAEALADEKTREPDASIKEVATQYNASVISE